MKTIVYAGGELMTGDDIATALLDYAQALAEAQTADTVEIPVRDADGFVSRATILIGPASQIMLKEVESGDELIDGEAVAALRSAARHMRPEARPQARRPDASWLDEF